MKQISNAQARVLRQLLDKRGVCRADWRTEQALIRHGLLDVHTPASGAGVRHYYEVTEAGFAALERFEAKHGKHETSDGVLRLYHDQRGEVACEQHTPMRGSDTWVWDRWELIPEAMIPEYQRLGLYQCELCEFQKRRAAAGRSV
jgi:hypothetical protein